MARYSNGKEYLKLPRSSSFKKVFLACLEKKFHDSREYDLEKYPAAVEIKMHINDTVQFGVGIQLQFQYLINRLVEADIKNEMFVYIHAHVTKGVVVDKAVLLYQVENGFKEEEFSQDAIRRAYYRRLEFYNKIFCGTVTNNLQ